jgi:type III pantothenate kinase
MILLCDVGNTHAHIGLGNRRRVMASLDLETRNLASPESSHRLEAWLAGQPIEGACFCSVVPAVVPQVMKLLSGVTHGPVLALTFKTVLGVGIRYPKPETIGQDRLANAVAVRSLYGAPSVVVDFGTAVTFDVVDDRGDYVGGVIAPGLSALTDYLHEKTALLPKIKIREPRRVVGKSTEEAMLAGAVYGYRGLVREILGQLTSAVGGPLPVVATGGYARLIARKMPEITSVRPNLTLEGLRLTWLANRATTCG